MKYLRALNTIALYPIIKATGFRFSKDYRHEITLYHKAVYSLVDTVCCNLLADSPYFKLSTYIKETIRY